MPQSSAGNIDQVVPSRSVSTAAPVPLSSPAAFGSGVTARISGAASVHVVAHGPGEIAGAGIAVAVVIHNAGTHAIDLGNVVVNVLDSSGTPGLPALGPPAKPFSGSLRPGSSASANFVFTMSASKRRPIRVTVNYTIDAPVALFVGDVG